MIYHLVELGTDGELGYGLWEVVEVRVIEVSQ